MFNEARFWHYRPAWTQLALRENLVGCEIGVLKGVNANFILGSLSIKKLYLVDPYYEKENYEIAKKVLKDSEDKLEWLIGTTEEKANEIPDDSLDFCYIDGNHEYEFVKKDIELCYPKVKVGAILGGHDFCRGHEPVVEAVLERFNRNDLFVSNRDWWIIK